MVVHADVEGRGKAPMIPREPEEAPKEEYLKVYVKILKDASIIKCKNLVEKMLKMILLPQD